MLISALITVATAFLFYHFIVKPFSYWKRRGVRQGRTVWIAGDNWGVLTRQQNFAEMVQDVYNVCPGGRYSGMYQCFLPTLVLKDPELIKQMTVKDFDHFTDHRSFVPDDVDPIWSKNLFSLKGQKWHDMRSILSPSFTSSKMKTMFVLMRECSENFVQYFLKKNEDVVSIEFKDTFTRFTNDVIATTAYGIKVDSLREPNNTFYLMGKDATDFSGLWRSLKFMGYFLFPKLYEVFKIKFFPEHTSKFFTRIIKETIRMREEQGIIRPDMIHLLMEARKGIQRQEENCLIDNGFATAKQSHLGKLKSARELTDMDIAAQAMIFFFGGFESASTLMCFLAYELAANPDVQNKLREEIISTLEDYGGDLTYESLLKMQYMDMVVSEALRKWPFVVAADRVCTKPYTIDPTTPDEKPLRLETGSLLWLPIFGIHRDPQYYPDPERFDPERFNDENKSNIKPYTYLPFGAGPRNCIGSRFALLETKTVFFYILKHFELVPVENSRIPLKLSTKHLNMTAEGGFWFGLKRIKTQT